jgi:hypothetical protein
MIDHLGSISRSAILCASSAALVLMLSLASPASAGTQNLITNGSFEQDTAMYSNT